MVLKRSLGIVAGASHMPRTVFFIHYPRCSTPVWDCALAREPGELGMIQSGDDVLIASGFLPKLVPTGRLTNIGFGGLELQTNPLAINQH